MPQQRIKRWKEAAYSSEYIYRSHPSLAWKSGETSLDHSGEMVSFNSPGPPYRSGNNWLLSKLDWEIGAFNANRYHTSVIVPSNMIFSGKVYGKVNNFQPVSDPGISDDASMISFGTTAIARVEPTAPNVSLAVSVAELKREGLPALVGHETWKNRTLEAKKASKNGSGEYLNYQFGWAPLVSDVKSLANSVLDHDKILRDYMAGSDKPIHRRYAPPQVLDQKSMNGQAIPIPTAFSQFGSGTAQSTLTKETWFEGAFRYHVPASNSQLDKMSRHASYARKLLGVELTPEVLWNLSPWSWASDWFLNTGDIMSNVSALGRDALVLQYGFTMDCRVLTEDHKTSFTYNGGVGFSSYRKILTYKKRVTASPYGFGFTDASLSTRQKAIIVALGLQAGGSRI